MEKIIEKILSSEKYTEKSYKKGDEIMSPLDKNSSFFIVKRGSCTVKFQALNGDVLTAYIYEEGSFFGESEIISPDKAPLLVIASEDCIVAVFDRDWFIRKIGEESEFSFCIMKSLADRMFDSGNKRSQLRFHTMKERYLLEINRNYEKKTLDKLTKKELTEQIGAPLRSLNRIVAQCGDIVCFKRKFIVKDEKALKNIVEEIVYR